MLAMPRGARLGEESAMVDTWSLFQSVLLLLMLMIPGFILRKTGLVDKAFPKGVSNLILYICQASILVFAFIRPYDAQVMQVSLGILLFTFLIHGLAFLIALKLFKKSPAARARVYRFTVLFSNAGYMGIPIITAILGEEAAIYASMYVVGFSFFLWSAGYYLYTQDASRITAKKLLLNPSTIPTYIGLLVFVLPIDQYIPVIVMDWLAYLKNMVAPLSMIIIGMQLATIDFKRRLIPDAGFAVTLAMRLLIMPALLFGITKLLQVTGIYYDPTAAIVSLVCCSAPAAAATGMFAEMFGGDSETAGKMVALTTVASIATIPLVSLLLKLL